MTNTGFDYLSHDLPPLVWLEHAYYVPKGIISKHDVIYDQDGRLIKASCLLRGPALEEDLSQAPPVLPETISDCGLPSLSGAYMFLGDFMTSHFGHMITEGIARFWSLADPALNDTRVLCNRAPLGIRETIRRIVKPDESHWHCLLDCFGLARNRFAVSAAPIRLARVAVPSASWLERHRVHSAHLQTTRKLASFLTKGRDIPKDPRPVYFSRTKLTKANLFYDHEIEVEDACRRQGWKIVYPERLTLAAQAELANAHNIFAGCVGSAFHTLLFRMDDAPLHCVYLGVERTYPNYLMMDQLLQAHSEYVPCIVRSDKSERHRAIVLEKALPALKLLLSRTTAALAR